MKVYIVSYKYTETYCSPHQSEWDELDVVLIATLDETLAQETRDEYNRGKTYRLASIKSHDLVSR